MNKELEELLKRFTYFIIMPNSKSKEDYLGFTRDSYFNRFDRRLLEAGLCLELISHLPINVKEIQQSWVTSANYYNHNEYYYIRFIQEQNINEDLLHLVEYSPFGCIFLQDKLPTNSQLIKRLLEKSRMPVVGIGNVNDDRIIKLTDTNIGTIAFQLLNKFVNEYNSISEQSQYISKHSFNIHRNKNDLNPVHEVSLKYITPLTSTIDRLRGQYCFTRKDLYLRFKDPTTKHNLKSREREADKLNIKYLRQIIAEKFLVLLLGDLEEGSFDKFDELRLKMFDINPDEITSLLNNPSPILYLNLVRKILEKFNLLSFEIDMVICIPSINRNLLTQISDSYALLRKEYISKYGLVDKQDYYEVLETIMNAETYYFGVDQGEKLINESLRYLKTVKAADFNDKQKVKEINQVIQKVELVKSHFPLLMEERAVEIEFLSKLYVMFTLARRVPYLRLRPISVKELYTMMDESYSSYITNPSELNKLFNSFSAKVNSSLPEELINLLLKHTATITFITDLPIEWIKLGGQPLNISKKISRIPISPGNGIVSHYNNLSEKSYVLREKRTTILLIDAVADGDDIKNHAIALSRILENVLGMSEVTFIYKEVTGKIDYFDVINNIKPDILIHYGHGDYDETDQGSLKIGNERIYSTELEASLNWKVPFVILGACESNYVKSTHLNMANMFLGSGAVSVIGTYFYVDASYTIIFISNLIKHLIFAFKTKVEFSDIGDIILMSHRTLYLIDLVHSLQARIDEKQIILDQVSEEVMDRSLRDFFKYCMKNDFSLEECYLKDKEIFKEVFSQSSILLQEFEEMLKNDEVFYHSLFFATLGSPDIMKIEKNKKLIEMDELHERLFSEISNRRRS